MTSWSALAAITLLAAGCETSAGPGVASIGATTTTTTPAGGATGSSRNLEQAYQAQLAYSQCMRSHGEPKFPDPVLTSHSLSISAGGIDTKSPAFIAASTACKKLVPDGGPPSAAQIAAAVAALLKYASCMRSHGEPDFPDPVTSGGGVGIRIDGGGVDPNSPQFKSAQRACVALFPKALG